MYEGCSVELEMRQMILEEGKMEERIHYGRIISYDADQARMRLLLRGEPVEVISLDAIYRCKIMDGERSAECEGMVLERYLDRQGDMLVFQIENGFYKNSLN